MISAKDIAVDVGKKLDERIDKANIYITVFLLGPGDSSTSPGKELREYIRKKCDKVGIAVKGEHKDIIEEFNRKTKDLLNLCVMEYFIAEEIADVIVIIPDSPGSLAELGMFVFNRRIYNKTLLLFSKEYDSDDESFINDGIKSHYELKKVSIKEVDYSKKLKTWRVVEEFIRPFKAEKFEEAVIG